MKITPKTEAEIRFEPLPDGEYPFTVLASDEIASKSTKNHGKMMFALKLNVHGKSQDSHVYDYFADWFSEWKLRHFAHTVGMLASYEAGDFNGASNALEGKVGYVKIGREEAGKYQAKNVVLDYIVRETKPQPASAPSEDPDDVPF